MAVTGSNVMTIPPVVMDKVDDSKCTPAFAGMKYCTTLQYVDAFSQDTAPYFPFTGDSKSVRLSGLKANNSYQIISQWIKFKMNSSDLLWSSTLLVKSVSTQSLLPTSFSRREMRDGRRLTRWTLFWGRKVTSDINFFFYVYIFTVSDKL